MSSNLDWPTPHTVSFWSYVAGGPDPHRNPASYSPALDQPGTPVQVYGWAFPSTTAPHSEGHPERVIADGDLYAPTTFTPPPSSVIGLPTGRYEVIGEVQDYSNGPFGAPFGVVINLRKVLG